MDKVDTVTTSRNCFGKLPTFVSLRLLCSLLRPLFHPPASPSLPLFLSFSLSLSICIIRYTSRCQLVRSSVDFRRLRDCFMGQNELAFLRIFSPCLFDGYWPTMKISEICWDRNGSCRGWKKEVEFRIICCCCCWYYWHSNFGVICSNWKHVFSRIWWFYGISRLRIDEIFRGINFPKLFGKLFLIRNGYFFLREREREFGNILN